MTARTERHLLAKTVLPGGETCEIEQAPSFDTSWARFAMAHSVVFRVLPDRPQTWHGLLRNYLQPLEALLWIASPDHNWVIEVKVLHVSQDQRQRQWIRLHAPLVQPYYAPPSRDSDRDDFLFVSGELPAGGTDSSPGFEVGYPHWLGVWNELRSVLIPVLSRSRAPYAYADDRLVTAAAALEALDKYSRKATGRLTSDLSTDEHELRVAELKRILDEHATPGLADWAVAAKSMNHIGLRQRIEAMIEFCGDVGKALTREHAVCSRSKWLDSGRSVHTPRAHPRGWATN